MHQREISWSQWLEIELHITNSWRRILWTFKVHQLFHSKQNFSLLTFPPPPHFPDPHRRSASQVLRLGDDDLELEFRKSSADMIWVDLVLLFEEAPQNKMTPTERESASLKSILLTLNSAQPGFYVLGVIDQPSAYKMSQSIKLMCDYWKSVHIVYSNSLANRRNNQLFSNKDWFLTGKGSEFQQLLISISFTLLSFFSATATFRSATAINEYGSNRLFNSHQPTTTKES